MSIDEIIRTNIELNRELTMALAAMERSDKIKEIRKKIVDNQKHCPHASAKYNWEISADGKCPYCGYTFEGRK